MNKWKYFWFIYYFIFIINSENDTYDIAIE